MEEDTGMVLAAALTGGVFVVLFVLVTVVLVLRLWRRHETAASSRGFVLFGVCFQDENLQSQVARPSLGRKQRWAPWGAEAATDDQDPDECELERWKKMFGGPTRCLSTIEEGTEKGTTPFTTPAFCTPASSPDRRDARTLQIATGALQS